MFVTTEKPRVRAREPEEPEGRFETTEKVPSDRPR
jgi:hypothetical protein